MFFIFGWNLVLWQHQALQVLLVPICISRQGQEGIWCIIKKYLVEHWHYYAGGLLCWCWQPCHLHEELQKHICLCLWSQEISLWHSGDGKNIFVWMCPYCVKAHGENTWYVLWHKIQKVCKMRLETPKDVEGLVTLLPGDLQQLGPVDMMQVLFCFFVSLCLQ